jgi:DNA invertase Pin-like site-specific DNA recombinase
MENGHFGYIRVSTPKQGERGVSLVEQRDAINRYADRRGLRVIRWFEEQETAAKRGRPVFADMLKLLRTGRGSGMIVHKVDRSARNLSDWAELGTLIDEGIDVRFANEDLDLRTRSGRLTADIQAVVAADYVRNLREEAKKGIYGRLKQGIYPLPAPIGYLDQGAGKAKIADPRAAPLVRLAFEQYAAGTYSLESLSTFLNRMGLRTKQGGTVRKNTVAAILRNPYYAGTIRIKRNGAVFRGAHVPLISMSLFDAVQDRLDGKVRSDGWSHVFPFRQLLKCKHCDRILTGERQKGHVYYRCHTAGCLTKGIREEVVVGAVKRKLDAIALSDAERECFRARLVDLGADWASVRDEEAKAIVLQTTQLRTRLDRLTDVYLDSKIDEEAFNRRKEGLLREEQALNERLATIRTGAAILPARVREVFELAESASNLHNSSEPAERRLLLETVSSNRVVDGKNVVITLAAPFSLLEKRVDVPHGGPQRDTVRTEQWFRRLVEWLMHHPLPDRTGCLPTKDRSSGTWRKNFKRAA